jgi:hypothetical protein
MQLIRVRGLGSGDWGLGIGVRGLGIGVWGLGSGVWGLGSRVVSLVSECQGGRCRGLFLTWAADSA